MYKARSVKYKKRKNLLDNIEGFLYISPWLIGFLFFSLWPLLQSFMLSFTQYDLLSTPKFIGLDNFKKFFLQDSLFIHSVMVTIKFVFIFLPVRMISALLVAVLLNKNFRGLSFYRSLYYIPSLIGTSVGLAVVWKSFFEVNGFLNIFLLSLDIKGPAWISDPKFALFNLAAMSAWQFGSSMVIFLAGLKQIPVELYESSGLDGANKIHQFIHITLPMLSPIILFNFVIQMIGGFQVFTQAYIITGGGPANSTLFTVLHIYETAFQRYDVGYASAMSWAFLVFIAVVTSLFFKVTSKKIFYHS